MALRVPFIRRLLSTARPRTLTLLDVESVREPSRLRTRGGSHPDDYVLTEELAAHHFDHFEPPTPDEGPLTVIG